MRAKLFIEGAATGSDSKEPQIRCREGFRRLLEKCGFVGRMPGLKACGGRDGAFGDFKIAQRNHAAGDYVAMLIDSEDPLADLESAWQHLAHRDHWERPTGAVDDQVLFMTTCVETWIVADREALRKHYGNKLQVSSLPPLVRLEVRGRHDVHDRLEHATRNCSNAYTKGKRSFEVLSKLTPAVLEEHLPSFVRTRRVLNENL